MTHLRSLSSTIVLLLAGGCSTNPPDHKVPLDGTGGSSDTIATGGIASNPTATGGIGVGTGGNPGEGTASGGSTASGSTAGTQTGGTESTNTGGTNGGGTESTGGATGSGAAQNGTGGQLQGGTPRTECPPPPPATKKDAAADRNLAVSKDDYAGLLTKETPFSGSRGQLPWHFYAPGQAAESPEKLFPLLVVLHGGYGREVTDGNIMVDVAQYLLGSQNGLLTEANRTAFPTYILLPHCRVEEGCTFGSNEWASAGGAHYEIQPQPSIAGGTALELVDYVLEAYSVDPSRVYLTGNSMGGGGTWEFASRRPELFAAVLPVSGHPPAPQFLAPIADAKLPVWAFGGENDSTNPYADTVAAISTIETAGGCAWLTTYNGTGHDDALWSSPYLEPGLWSWLFAQNNSSAPR